MLFRSILAAGTLSATASAVLAQSTPWVPINEPGKLFVLETGKVIVVTDAQISENQMVETDDSDLCWSTTATPGRS